MARAFPNAQEHPKVHEFCISEPFYDTCIQRPLYSKTNSLKSLFAKSQFTYIKGNLHRKTTFPVVKFIPVLNFVLKDF